MLLEAAQLSAFYATPAGTAVRRLILRRIRRFWPNGAGLRLLGYGYATPYLRPFLGDAERVAALMPARMGVIAWPRHAPPLTVMGEEEALPFPEAMFDRILLVHGLEGAENARVLLRQLWRVLAPEGRLLVVAPNRTSLWALTEASPFACGRPFRRSELDALLRDTLFEPEGWDRALHLPPHLKRRKTTPSLWWERMGRRLLPAMAGVHLVEAKKSLYGAAPIRKLKTAEAKLASAC